MTEIETKRKREKRMIREMITLYCNKQHKTKRGTRCPDCERLLAYAWQRIDHCPFIEEKTFCSKCKVHCYRPDMREKIRELMRWSGPRMIFHHPVMALRHLMGSKREKKVWDLYAPIYKCVMRADHKSYEYMYTRIPRRIRGREVLEIATGPGLLAKHVAPAARKMIATDYSDGMISEAKKGRYSRKLRFEVADAMDLPYPDDSFDVVVIANALHIVPDPEKVLLEIDRVLRPGGVLIAPNFVEHRKTGLSCIWAGILRIAGVRFEHQWTAGEYLQFLESNGWRITMSRKIRGRISLLYAECIREDRA